MHGQDLHHNAFNQGPKAEDHQPGVPALKLDHHQVFMATEVFRNEAQRIVGKSLGDDRWQSQRHIAAIWIKCALGAAMILGVMRLAVQCTLGKHMIGELHQHLQVGAWFAAFARHLNRESGEVRQIMAHAIYNKCRMVVRDRKGHLIKVRPSVAIR